MIDKSLNKVFQDLVYKFFMFDLTHTMYHNERCFQIFIFSMDGKCNPVNVQISHIKEKHSKYYYLRNIGNEERFLKQSSSLIAIVYFIFYNDHFLIVDFFLVNGGWVLWGIQYLEK